MRDWFSTSDLAALALPGFPATRGGWEQIAQREGWENHKDKVRARKGRGGGLEYHVELLSAEALTALAMRNIGVVDITVEDAARGDEKPFAPGTEGRDARLAIISAADRFAKAASLSRIVADRLFGHLYNAGQTPIEPWVRASVPKISPRSLWRWRAHKSSGAVRGSRSIAAPTGAARARWTRRKSASSSCRASRISRGCRPRMCRGCSRARFPTNFRTGSRRNAAFNTPSRRSKRKTPSCSRASPIQTNGIANIAPRGRIPRRSRASTSCG